MKRGKSIFSKEKLKTLAKPTKKKVIIAACAVIVLAGVGIMSAKKKNVPTVAAQGTDIVTRGDVEVTITGSAAVEPYERYEIIPKVSGDIIYCPYEVGDSVAKDDILYQFDSSNSDLTVERQRISMQQSENNYRDALEESEKLVLKAKNNGVISGLTIKVGEEVNSGTKIASVDETTQLEVDLPFTQAQINTINVGDAAVITSSKHMSSISGTVTHKSNSSYAGNDGTTLYNVTIEFSNPGAFYDGMTVGGSVGGNVSPGSGTITNATSGTIVTETDGTVSKIYYSNGDYVTKGTVVATLTSDTVSDKIADSTLSYKSAKLSMEQTEKDLEDYTITSPISGTVITKNSKAGDTIDKTNSTTTMMVIADISRLKFELAIDELDVDKVHEGQEVSITCDALPDETFTGIITNVSVEGTASNGVTTYSAEVEIPEPGNLRPSMNIDASIIVESAYDVLMIPTADIKTAGGRSFVFVKGSVDNASEKKGEKNGENMPRQGEGRPAPQGEMPQNGEAPEGGISKQGEPTAGGKTPEGGNKRQMMPEAPEGYTTVQIQTGIANEDYTEVISGLSEGQEVYSQTTESSGGNNMMMGGMGGMPGGMGGMPGGNMGGGARGGMGGGPGGGMR
ncbi:MAG: HlyD family efflux transporter periplasmic adaptor subunit [Clostridia bacterium]|nr:HlyD family efflux transporter periplasmic adaptor subunit [Clostridia bacterium]MBP3360099.1 HlyD family efflux transporter periplasmic adaptor subunit [Clostridia bacterium]